MDARSEGDGLRLHHGKVVQRSGVGVRGKNGLQKTVSFSYAKYGEQASNLLALHWTHKMQYLFNIYRDSDQHGYVFSDTDVDGHVPERTFSEFIEGVPLESPILQRVHQIKAIRPKRPVIAPGVAASSGD